MATRSASLPHGAGAAAWSELLADEALVLGLLGRVLGAYPDPQWVGFVLRHGLLDGVPMASGQADVRRGLDLLQEWTELHRGGDASQALRALEDDFVRLFVGAGAPVLAPPWESVYLSARHALFQEQTLEVRGWYARFGLEAVNKQHEPDDHAGLELEFLGHLAATALTALEEKDRDGFARAIAAQREFLTEHVLRWMPEWCDHVGALAATGFYRGLALVTRGVLTELSVRLGEPAGALEAMGPEKPGATSHPSSPRLPLCGGADSMGTRG